MTGEDATPGKDRSWASGNSEGEESRMHTEQSRMVRASLEATAHPDVYARRKVAVSYDVETLDLCARAVWRQTTGAGFREAHPWDSDDTVARDARRRATERASAMLQALVASADEVAETWLVGPRAVEGDHDDPDHCTCPTTQRDVDGNCDLLEQDDCPVHGVAPDSADTRLHRFEVNAEARDRGPSIIDGAHPVTEEAYMANLGRRREGWRGRLAHVEMLLAKAEEWFVPGSEPLEPLAQALAEVRALIDEG